jgi:hypothetical protein
MTRTSSYNIAVGLIVAVGIFTYGFGKHCSLYILKLKEIAQELADILAILRSCILPMR